MAMGLSIAFHKGEHAAKVDWIGLSVSVAVDSVEISINAKRVEELRGLTAEALTLNVIGKKWLRTYVGKASSFASVLVFWRPFLADIWAALFFDEAASRAPT
eukprot:8167976-Heterocapsa_arctica.AAC.1